MNLKSVKHSFGKRAIGRREIDAVDSRKSVVPASYKNRHLSGGLYTGGSFVVDWQIPDTEHQINPVNNRNFKPGYRFKRRF